VYVYIVYYVLIYKKASF